MTASRTTIGAPIRDVVVIGGGLVGWSAAAALKRRLPVLNVAILPLVPPADALADHMVSALPSILGFHGDLGLREEDAVVRSGSAFRLGTRFVGWADGLPDYVHAYGEHGQPLGTASFHQHWVRAAKAGGAAPFDAYSPAAMLGRADRFPLPGAGGDPLTAGIEYGLTIDVAAHVAMLRAFARHCGVVERPGELAGVALRADGFVDTLALADGSSLGGDLFVDCSGPAARVRARLDDAWEDWRRWLPCDRVMVGEAPPAPTSLDSVTAFAAGWRWTAGGVRRTSRGVVWSSAHGSDTDAARELGEASAPVTIAAGTRPQPWLRNCVAIGDAATVIEPLEWTNLHLAHSAIDRLVAMMPDRDCAPVEIGDFNRQCAAEAMRVRDFVILHYATARRGEPFWRDVAAVEPPPSLAHTLAQFGERGRLPVYEEETFARDSWLAVMLGQGFIPRRTDPLIDAVPTDHSTRALAQIRDAVAAAVAAAPRHAAILQAMNRQIAR